MPLDLVCTFIHKIIQRRCIGIIHFPEAARFPNIPVLAGRKVNFTLRLQSQLTLTLRPAIYFTPRKSQLRQLRQLTVRLTVSPPPPHSVWTLKQPLSFSYLILSYLFSFA